ncbi:MAG: protein translocase subunit SecF [Candidatus Nealsonbacteria bacterium]|nr:MAG: protein translocase subunit SecF [Candidatus Nealsonbacteria bacterium]
MNLNFLKYKKIYFIFSGTLILASLVCLIIFGLKPGIDFTGGSILEIEYIEERPSNQEIKETLSDLNLGGVLIQPTGERGIIIKMKDISEDTHQEVIQKLKENKGLEERRFESIGPVIGQELKQKTKIVIILSLLAIVLYIAWAFRKISRPIPSWQYGIASLVALFHDVLIPIGILSVLGKFYGVQITIPVITALLAVLGYSINNTVVVFDRIRENLLKQTGTYHEIVNKSLNQTLTRSLNTSLTTLFVLVAIFFLGGVTLKYFALALILGIIAGTYSSLFLASPILVAWLRWRKGVI